MSSYYGVKLIGIFNYPAYFSRTHTSISPSPRLFHA